MKTLVVKKYLINIMRAFALLLIVLPFQNCIEMKGFDAENSSTDSSIDNENNNNDDENENNGLVPVFFAIGQMKSSMYSCDGGETWKGYKAENGNLRCWEAPENFDCHHDTTSVVGGTYGPSGFMMTSGWGKPGKVELTTDGKNFTTVDEGSTWSGIAYGNGAHILNSRRPIVSIDDGQNWINGGPLNFIPWNSRGLEFIDQGAGFFISMAYSAEGDMMISHNNGETWDRPRTLLQECTSGAISHNDDNVILLKTRDNLCISENQGQDWQIVSTPPPEFTSNLIFADGKFKLYARRGFVYSSIDGVTWSRDNLKLSGLDEPNLYVNGISYHKSLDRYVSITQSWNSWYENTKYYYSDDGIDWIAVDKSSGAAPVAPHPLKKIISGFMETCD